MQRRDFLKLSAGTGLGVGLLPLSFMAQSAGFADYKCLLNIYLFGGNDGFNLIVPRSDAEYNIYAQSRQNLALAKADLLPITPDISDGASYGLHPSALGIQSMFDRGDAAFVANIGPLIEPVSKDAYVNGTATIPPRLFSHNDQQDQWHSLKGRSKITTGWAGRIADNLSPLTSEQRLAINTSSIGTTLFQSGELTIPYTVGTDGASSYGAFAADVELGLERRAAFEAYLAKGFSNMHTRALSDVHQRSLATADLVNNALALIPALNTSFPDTQLGRQLNIIARLIAVKDEFSMSRQVFYAGMGGFDTHDSQNQVQPELFSDLSNSMTAFIDAMIEIGQNDNVIAFTQSDFGRTLTSNGDGTDHGWGSHQLVVGGPVRGRHIYGTMPQLEINGPDDATGGRIIPSLSVDQYAASLARWFGVEESKLVDIAPAINNFASSDIGFV